MPSFGDGILCLGDSPIKDNYIIMRISLLFMALTTLAALSPCSEKDKFKKVEGVYIGHLENGYFFCCKTKAGGEEVVVFDRVLSVILESYALQVDQHIGENFIISFTNDVMVRFEGKEEISTIIHLEQHRSGQHQ